VLEWLDGREAEFGPDWRLDGTRAAVLAELGRFEEARLLHHDFRQAHEDRGDLLNLGAHLSQGAVQLELLAGDPVAAAAYAERGIRILEEAGEQSWLSTGACWYADALYELGRIDEAGEWARKGLELADADDMATQVIARQVLGRVLARRGELSEAERIAHEAVTLVDATDALTTQGAARVCLAEVHELAGRRDEATTELRAALERYERKGAVVLAEGVRRRLAASEPTSA
jgi:tetratricopeptide (TPR) repeat protein